LASFRRGKSNVALDHIFALALRHRFDESTLQPVPFANRDPLALGPVACIELVLENGIIRIAKFDNVMRYIEVYQGVRVRSKLILGQRH
jgi:hypothetical protein